jgi:hypothetical protein
MVDAMGVVRLLGKQQPDKMRTYKLRPITETAEQAREAKGQKGKIAKQIVLGRAPPRSDTNDSTLTRNKGLRVSSF